MYVLEKLKVSSSMGLEGCFLKPFPMERVQLLLESYFYKPGLIHAPVLKKEGFINVHQSLGGAGCSYSE